MGIYAFFVAIIYLLIKNNSPVWFTSLVFFSFLLDIGFNMFKGYKTAKEKRLNDEKR